MIIKSLLTENNPFNSTQEIKEWIERRNKEVKVNLRSVRPVFGLHPKYLKECIGRRVNRDLEKGTRMSLEFIK